MKAILESFLHLINCGEYKTIMKITYVSFRFCVTYNKRDLKNTCISKPPILHFKRLSD